MTKRSYWLDLFTGVTWNEFKAAGGKVSGFRESRWTTVQKSSLVTICFVTLRAFPIHWNTGSRWSGIQGQVADLERRGLSLPVKGQSRRRTSAKHRRARSGTAG